jgi:hypothetical protein
MNAEIIFLGKRFDMARRIRRRILVVAIYATLAALMIFLWFFGQWRGTGAWLIWGAMLACRLFLGGYYNGGLVKAFNNKRPRQSLAPPPLLLLKLRVYQPVLAADENSFRNDERELHLRDRAHYQAYQAIGIAILLPWFAAQMRLIRPGLTAWIPMTPDQLYFGLITIVLLLFFTLPQAILLWTEPDMEQEQPAS